MWSPCVGHNAGNCWHNIEMSMAAKHHRPFQLPCCHELLSAAQAAPATVQTPRRCKPAERPLTLADVRARCPHDPTAQLLVRKEVLVSSAQTTAAAAWHRLTAASSFPVRYFLMRRAALICVGLTAGSLKSGPPRLLHTK